MSYKSLVFIGSCAYSGSTLLDMLLGSIDGVAAVGEVQRLAEHFPDKKGNGICTCGVALSGCPFWLRVQSELGRQLNHPHFSLANYPLRVPEPSSQNVSLIHRLIPNATETMLIVGLRSLWQLGQAIHPTSGRHAAATTNTLNLFEVIARVHGTPVIADSSKAPLHLKLLYMADPSRFKLIHLVRDGRGVSLSCMTRRNQSIEAASRWWVRYNRNLQWMMATIPRRQIYFIRYEDICMDPVGEMAKVCQFLDIEGTVDFANLTIEKDRYHMIAGNPMRTRRSENQIVLDEKWRKVLDAQQLRAFDRIAGKMNRGFGYKSADSQCNSRQVKLDANAQTVQSQCCN